MTNPFDNMAYNPEEAKDTDNLGGAFTRLESGVYELDIKLAYLTFSKKGAMGFNLEATTPEGKVFRETQYITNKEGSNKYKNSKGEEKYNSAFLTMNSLALLTTGKPLTQQVTAKKHINIYSYEKKAEVPTEVIMLVDFIGKKFFAGIIKRREDQQTPNPSSGLYENTGKDRIINTIDKVFQHKSKMTESELRAKATEPKFIESWKAKWDNVTDDRYKGVQGQGNAGAPGGNFAGGSSDSASAGAPPKDNPFI